MTRKHFTVALHNLPRDIEKRQIISKVDRIALDESCRVSIGPLVNIYNADRNNVISRSTTVALQGSKWKNVVSKLEGLQIASNSEQQNVRVDRRFFGITSLAEIEDSTIDVYNIHGLGGHAFETWACDIDNKNPATIKAWPRDFLPLQFKKHGLKARFATIGYNANVVGNVDVTGTIRSAAENLLSQLIADRPEHSEASKRPMYFICHSLGGLVLCEALILLLSGREEFEYLASRYRYLFIHNGKCLLKGIVFFGTPFQGSAKANQISPFVTALATINPFPTNPKIVNELKNVPDGSSKLDDISDAANIIMVRHGIEILVACETQPVSGTGRTPVTERNSALGVFKDRIIPITIHADHVEMVKFKHESSDYGVVLSRLIQMVKDTDPTFDPSQALQEVGRDDDSIMEPIQSRGRVQTAPPAAVGAAGNQTIIHIHNGGFGYQWDAEGDYNFSNNPNNPDRHGGNSRDVRNRFSGSLGPVAEQSNSQSPNPQPRDSTPVPPDIGRLHVRSDPIVPTQSSLDGSEYSRLGMFDTVFIIDDTLSMRNPVHSNSTGHHQMSRWGMLERSLEYIVNITTTHDKDGVDVQFLKNPKLNGQKITDPNVFLDKLSTIRGLLENSSPGTEFLDDLIKAINPHLEKFILWKTAMEGGKSLKKPKPLNLIVITDGHADDHDEVTWYLTNVARQLDSMRAPPRQIGVQFVQVGDDEQSTVWLRKLDDELGNGKVRDIIDTTPFDYQSGDVDQEEFELKTILRKIVLGGVTNKIDQKILGEEHPDTLMSLSNMGLVLGNQGKYEAAEEVHRRALSTREKLLGEEHPDTLMSLSNMGLVFDNQGKYEEAERLHRRVLSARERTLGYEHPNTLSSVNYLADVLSDQGKYDKAEKLYRQGLSAREKVLGERHPDTLTSINNLAHVLQKQNLAEEAEIWYKRAQPDREIALGREPSDTPMSVNKSELVLGNQGNYKSAENLHQGAPSAKEKTSGNEPPNTLSSVNKLADVLSDQGNYDEAENLYRRGLSAREKVLGERDPDTLTIVNKLADVLSDQGKYDEAEKLYRRGLSAREKVLGERHPDTLTSVNNLAHVLQKQNLVEEAEMLYKRLRSDREITLGRVGSPGPVAEQNNSKSTSQQFQDSTPVPPDMKRLHYQSDGTAPSQSSLDGNDYPRLGMLDTVVIIGDTLSMINPVHSESMGNNQVSRWSMLERSLEHVINIITTHNKNGVDIQFLKHPKQNGQNITELDVFHDKLRIVGGLLQNSTSSTNFFDDLKKAISPYLEGFRVWKAAMVERRSFKRPKPLSLIVLTDSHASDDSEVTWYLTDVAKQLDSMRAPPRQIGIQFVQIGDDEKATSWFRKLDDELGNGKFRDMIDVTPFEYQRSADGDQELFKVLSKAILRKIELGGAKNDIDPEANLYGPLTRTIMSVPSDRIWFSAEDDLSVWNKIKAFVENHTEENWNWWPLRPRMRLLQKNQTRLHWRCHCNTHLWKEISIAQAKQYQFLLSPREDTQQNHLCRLRRRKTSMLAFLAGILHAAGSNSNPRVWFGSLGMSSGTSQQGTRISSTGSVGQTSIRMTSQGTASSNPQPSQTGNNIARVNQLFVLFGVKGTRRTPELAQMNTYNYATDGEFFEDLKKEYRGLRGYLRYWFSVWQFSHCDFVKFEKSRAGRIFFRRKEIPTDSNYVYQPKPPDAEDPPITPHEFEFAFTQCITQCLWSVFHDCNEPPSGTLAIERIPKRKSLFELSREDSEVKPAWGLQAQHAVALTQVIFYHVLILAGPFGFWAWWEDRRPTDLQNAAVPLTTVAVFLSVFWSASGLLKMSRQSV